MATCWKIPILMIACNLCIIAGCQDAARESSPAPQQGPPAVSPAPVEKTLPPVVAPPATVQHTIAASEGLQPPAGDAAPMIQKALDAAAAKGGTVQLGVGQFRLDQPIRIPDGVALVGVWEGPHHAQLPRGTVFHVYAGHGDENGPPLVQLGPSTTIRGVTFFYPQQKVPDPVPYPWTIQGRGMHGNIIECTFVNPYKAIDFGTHANELHYIRNCYGCPLKIGVHIDRCTDIGRIENVHFNPHYWGRAEVAQPPDWNALVRCLWENLVAFEFARTDWEYVLNTFCFGAKVGYRFYGDKDGTVNGNFLGIGADWCHRALLVEASQAPGLLITNGEFVGGQGAEAIMEVTGSHRGVVMLNNCAFWGPAPGAAIVDGTGSVSFSQCNFQNWVHNFPQPLTLDLRGGHVSVQHCLFQIDQPDITLGPAVSAAVVMGNCFVGNREIDNRTSATAEIIGNVVRPKPN